MQLKGFTLVETLVAVAILTIVIVGPITIAQKGIQNAHFAGDQLTAVFLAQEAVEGVRELRDKEALEAYDAVDTYGSFDTDQDGTINSIDTNDDGPATALYPNGDDIPDTEDDDANGNGTPDVDEPAGGGGETWGWLAEESFAPCLTETGCSINITTDTPTFEACSTSGETSTYNRCQLNIDDEGRYGYGSGHPSPFTRIIRIGNPDADGGVPVTVTVSWDTTMFAGGSRQVAITTWIYDHYQRFED